LCSTCHNSLPEYTLYEVAEVEFPSGALIDSGDPEMNLCMNCHQGRSSTVTVDSRTAGKPDDTVDEALGFINIHYFAAGATIFGNEVQGGYEYAGKTYVGRYAHVTGFDTCSACHSAHQLEVKVDACTACHTEMEPGDVETIRKSTVDFDGDGDAAEGLAAEVDTMRAVLYEAILDYASASAGTAVIYDSHAYPYFFTDTNANGESDPGEAIYPNRYATWTPRLLKAAYNFQYAAKDLGAFAHNGAYVLELLYDSIQDLGGNVAGMTRP